MFLLPLFCLFSNAIGQPADQPEGRSGQGVGVGLGKRTFCIFNPNTLKF